MAKKVTMRILRVGKFKDSKGKEHEFTGEKLKVIADGFSFSGEEDLYKRSANQSKQRKIGSYYNLIRRIRSR